MLKLFKTKKHDHVFYNKLEELYTEKIKLHEEYKKLYDERIGTIIALSVGDHIENEETLHDMENELWKKESSKRLEAWEIQKEIEKLIEG